MRGTVGETALVARRARSLVARNCAVRENGSHPEEDWRATGEGLITRRVEPRCRPAVVCAPARSEESHEDLAQR
jgi:hypothetical protein